MNYKLNYMCLKRGVSLILGHGVVWLLQFVQHAGLSIIYCCMKQGKQCTENHKTTTCFTKQALIITNTTKWQHLTNVAQHQNYHKPEQKSLAFISTLVFISEKNIITKVFLCHFFVGVPLHKFDSFRFVLHFINFAFLTSSCVTTWGYLNPASTQGPACIQDLAFITTIHEFSLNSGFYLRPCLCSRIYSINFYLCPPYFST